MARMRGGFHQTQDLLHLGAALDGLTGDHLPEFVLLRHHAAQGPLGPLVQNRLVLGQDLLHSEQGVV